MWWHRKKTDTARVSAEDQRQAELDRATVGSGRIPRSTIVLVGFAAVVVSAFGLSATRSVVAPVLLALVLTICVHPLRVILEERGVPRSLATGSVITAVFVLLAALIDALIFALAQFGALLPQFAPQLEAAGKAVGDWLSSLGFGQQQVQAIVSSLSPGKILGLVTGLLGGVASIAFGGVVVLTSLILMAADATFLGPIFRQLREKHSALVIGLQSYASGVRRYMVVTTVLGIAQGAADAVVLWLLGVPGAFLWGLLAFICSFIPNIGYFIAIVPPIVFGLLSGGFPLAIWVILLYALINGVLQSVVQPRVVGNAVALSQTITFVSVLLWSLIIGPIGAILAIPLTLLVRTLLVDTDPAARWWRPVLGDLSQARVTLREEDARRREKRKR